MAARRVQQQAGMMNNQWRFGLPTASDDGAVREQTSAGGSGLLLDGDWGGNATHGEAAGEGCRGIVREGEKEDEEKGEFLRERIIKTKKVN